MKDIFIILVSVLITLTNQQKLQLNSYSSQPVAMKTGTWYDLINILVECPNSGVIKNFALKTDGYNIWYDFQCYSSVKPEPDEGEPIIKQVILTTTSNSKYYVQPSIKSLDSFSVDCWSDYGLRSFKLYTELTRQPYGYYYSEVYQLKKEAICHGVKPSYTTPINVQTTKAVCEEYYSLKSSYSCLFDIVVGSTATENDVDIGFPLRGFKYIIENSQYQGYPTGYYLYSYSKLRNMKVVKDSYEQKFKQLRDSNTQKN